MTPWTVMLLASLLVSVVVLLIYKGVSNQALVARTRNRVIARVLEIRLYQDDVIAVLTAPFRVLLACGRYLGASLKPLAVSALPVTLVLVGLAGWLDYRPLQVNESTTVTATAKDSTELSIAASPGLVVETDALRMPRGHETAWRVRAMSANATFDILAGADRAACRVAVATSLARVRPTVNGVGPITSVRVDYPHRTWRVGSWQPHWLTLFAILTLAWCVALMPPLRVQM